MPPKRLRLCYSQKSWVKVVRGLKLGVSRGMEGIVSPSLEFVEQCPKSPPRAISAEKDGSWSDSVYSDFQAGSR
jgi:hypothetical protein